MLTDNIFETELDQSRPNHIEIDDTVRASLDQIVEAISLPSTRAQNSRSSQWRLLAMVVIGLTVVRSVVCGFIPGFVVAD